MNVPPFNSSPISGHFQVFATDVARWKSFNSPERFSGIMPCMGLGMEGRLSTEEKVTRRMSAMSPLKEVALEVKVRGRRHKKKEKEKTGSQ